jgi:Carboxypeptidase regulatory-like domain
MAPRRRLRASWLACFAAGAALLVGGVGWALRDISRAARGVSDTHMPMTRSPVSPAPERRSDSPSDLGAIPSGRTGCAVVNADDGRPVPGAEITVVDTGSTHHTNDAGWAVLGLRDNSCSTVRIRKEGFALTERTAVADQSLLVRLTPAQGIRGMVVDTDGAPVSDAKVWVSDALSGAVCDPPRSVGSDGTFATAGLLGNGPVELHAVASGFAEEHVTCDPRTTNEVKVVLGSGALLHGYAATARGHGDVGPVDVRVFRVTRAYEWVAPSLMPFLCGDIARTTTAPDGHFEIRGLARGDYWLYARTGNGCGAVPTVTTVRIEGAVPRECYITLEGPTGVVVRVGNAPYEIEIAAVRASGVDAPVVVGRGASVGDVVIAPLDPGEYRVVLTTEANISWAKVQVSRNEVRRVEPVPAASSTIEGTVVDRRGVGVHGVVVSIEMWEQGGVPSAFRTTNTDANGAFVLRGVPIAPGTLTVSDTLRRFVEEEMDGVHGGAGPLAITIDRAAVMRARVVPVPRDRMVEARLMTAGGLVVHEVSVADDGTFEARCAEGGQHDVRLRTLDGEWCGEVTVPFGGDVELGIIDLERPASVTVNVRNGRGAPVAGASVVARSEKWNVSTCALTDGDGQCELEWIDETTEVAVYESRPNETWTPTVTLSLASVPDGPLKIVAGE